ncbi:MAG: hypothetical protein PHY47_17745 [Lachnospiraceae bacterium]|nr:hypothetical protein [Lachnospiraceae bacterium]
MGRRYVHTKFAAAQIEILSASKFTSKVDFHHIWFTLEFQSLLLTCYEKEETSSEIFSDLGYDIAILGDNRFYGHPGRLMITYIPCCGVFFYLSVIKDAYTMQILAYVLSNSLEVDFVLKTVNILLSNHGAGLDSETLIHSNQNCHYTSKKFRQIIGDSVLRESMSRRGNCWLLLLIYIIRL